MMDGVSVYAYGDPTVHEVEADDSIDPSLVAVFLGSLFPASPDFDMRSA